ncbi:probable receptor-like protein kinase At5g59700 [Lactuca sativa]|uniref:non-specific serine/threonine protein kinase n=1 Tax=Lactuca sativa TaxID=4236 RepID=A0A9R1VGE9_LACSA|nr:probable receptor-like protein kinase At5g59700 [Lactuca sativa]XP_042754797.1 probable receptor-like protein kinase At5g59700 [Lactuca sativa]XP_042754799.1 probable receptor-like protein kinase At5g59700 [Lactuca sativa]XP_042754800.1 probable receptor-like protein kinase At5g59700 [Lactuca sativa]XP_042754801.1 probable receptor-like protein kinase At5g59700 [Lactuca sativa]XP_042754802.1 probable receptor-like protein kinase At5g59700 [Lactuca sativa]XP_042754803.1 probable receptor-li
MNPRALEEFTRIAYQCLRDFKQRPTMKEVLAKLESALEYQIIETTSFPKEFEDLKIQLEAILLATNHFSNENCIGEGGFGKVYKGKLVYSKGQITVALKRLDYTFQQRDLEFWKEMIMLSLYRHENIVPLLGFCDDHGEKIIVYEYVSRSGLDVYLDSHDLSWVQRLKICIGAARGLAYLHSDDGTNRTVLHRDIKSSNIVLDESWNAKIADVGLSKFGRSNQQYKYLVDNVVGTVGYCDPVYFETGSLTKESDIYSFGVVLFEVLCGRLCLIKNDKHQSFTVLVRKCYKQNNLNEIIYGKIKDEIHPSSLEVFARVGYQCLKRSRDTTRKTAFYDAHCAS